MTMTARRKDWEPIDLSGVKTYSLHERQSKVGISSFAKAWKPGDSFSSFLDNLPAILAASDLRRAVSAISTAVRNGGTVVLGMGAHPIKVGLNPVLIDAMERGILSGLAFNGAVLIHDLEIALAGKTSEDVAAHLGGGEFGMARETAEFIHHAIGDGYNGGNVGLGRAVGNAILKHALPHAELSILATAARLGLPATAHVAIGTDIIHMHPEMDGAATGALSHRDFKLFCSLASELRGGVFINLGSAVVIPEIFLKAVSVVRNLGYPLDGLTTINMDFQRHYRPMTNVVSRPTLESGTGINLTGHHEIMFPLLMAAVMDNLHKEA